MRESGGIPRETMAALDSREEHGGSALASMARRDSSWVPGRERCEREREKRKEKGRKNGRTRGRKKDEAQGLLVRW